jgi:hypothetical protein
MVEGRRNPFMSSHPSVLAPALAALLISIGGGRSDVPRWYGDFDRARSLAEAERMPLLVCFNADLGGEPANRAMALEVYRDPKLLRTLDDAVPVICSIDEHDSSPFCARFGHVTCAEHRAAEKLARRYLFGGRRDLIAPQHVVLLPDGTVFWHSLYATSASTIARAVEDARKAFKQNARARRAAHLARFRKLVSGAATDDERYLLLSTAFGHAPKGTLGAMLRRVRPPALAVRLLRSFADLAPERAYAELNDLGEDCPAALREVVAELKVALEPARVQAYDAGTDPAASPLLRPTVNDPSRAPAPPLPVLGAAQEIPGTVFPGGAHPALEGSADRPTLLLFFLPNDANLARQLQIWNRVAKRFDGRVRTIGLGASITPSTDLERTVNAGFGFEAGNYSYAKGAAPYEITTFPAAVLLDTEGKVRFSGDAYTGFEGAVARLLKE